METAPFQFPTLGAYETHMPRVPYASSLKDPQDPFRIGDPFGLRRAVFPVFQRDPDGEARGMGTAFHVDGWGRLLTADHVVDYTRAHHLEELRPAALIRPDISRSQHAAVLLGYGLVFGTITIPEATWAAIERIDAVIQQNDDPLEALRQGQSYRTAVDLAGLTALLHPNAPVMHTLPVDFRWKPKVGERVLAVGFPELGVDSGTPEHPAHYLTEGMFGAYGHITDVFPQGRGRAHPTPVFEVEADWQSGMSGGPVFNDKGYVVGVVSRSLAPTKEEPGVGYAACLSWIPEAPSLVPTLDADNPGWRLGFGVFRPSPWHLAHVSESKEDADREQFRLGNDYIVAWGSHRMGSKDFIASE